MYFILWNIGGKRKGMYVTNNILIQNYIIIYSIDCM